jgi:Kef-type K+ transport system membrane component KefB
MMATLAGLLAPLPVALATTAPSAHHDPAAQVVLSLAVILLAAKLGGDLATRAGQPAVLGELLAGVVLGNLTLAGISVFEPLESDLYLDMFARIGVLILLFEVGLESTLADMLRVGTSALLVACLGVAAPFALGWAVGAWLLPSAGAFVHAFLGATLAATSVGITARVLQDLGRSRSNEARVILGAAVIDDVLGLVILAAVTAIIMAADRGGTLSYVELGGTLLKAIGVLAGAMVIGMLASRRIFNLAARLRTHGVLLVVGLSFCFLFSWLATVVGLAAIVGAFAAGLILEEGHYHQFTHRGEKTLHDLMQPISGFLVPVFFVLMGMRTDLLAFGTTEILALAGALTIAAIIGKQLSSLGVLDRGIDRITVGIGMIPRGEVGLIFANVGLGLTLGGVPVVDTATFSAVVVMVIATTMVTPPALKWSMSRLPQQPETTAR